MKLRTKLDAMGKSAAEIQKIIIRTHEACLRIIDKTGPLSNPADRDHCVQYMVAIPMLFGRLTAVDYEDSVASDPRIDELRAKDRLRRRATLHRRLSRSEEKRSIKPIRSVHGAERRHDT